MIALLADAPPVVMPMWVFLILVVLLVGLNAFLMWCNHEQARTIRRQSRQLRHARRTTTAVTVLRGERS